MDVSVLVLLYGTLIGFSVTIYMDQRRAKSAKQPKKSAKAPKQKLNLVPKQKQQQMEDKRLPEESKSLNNTSETLDKEAQERVMRMVREKQLRRQKNPMGELSARAKLFFGGALVVIAFLLIKMVGGGPNPCDCADTFMQHSMGLISTNKEASLSDCESAYGWVNGSGPDKAYRECLKK